MMRNSMGQRMPGRKNDAGFCLAIAGRAVCEARCAVGNGAGKKDAVRLAEGDIASLTARRFQMNKRKYTSDLLFEQ